jgi:F-box and WD-40 domain protein 1/11
VTACLAVSRTWRGLVEDNAVWRALFDARDGWRVDLSRGSPRRTGGALDSTADLRQGDSVNRKLSIRSARSVGSARTTKSSTSKRINSSLALSKLSICPGKIPAPLTMDWKELFKGRLELDRRWVNREPRVMRLSGHSDR